MHLPIYELGTNDLRAGASLRDAKRSEYEEVLDGGIAVRVPLDSRLLKTADKEDHHDYRTALAMLGLESPESGTVRVLRIPGLYVSALWAVTDAGGTVTPVAPVPRFLEARPYEEDEFEAVVRKRAQKIAEHRRDSDDRAAP